MIALGDDHREYWECLLVVCKAHASRLRRHGPSPPQGRVGELPEVVEESALSMIRDKSYEELLDIESEVNDTLRGEHDFEVDPAFWEALLKHLQEFKVKARLKELHLSILKERLALLDRLEKDPNAKYQLNLSNANTKSQGNDGNAGGGVVVKSSWEF